MKSDSKTKLVNISDIKSAIKMKGPLGTIVASIIMRVLGFSKMNSLYTQVYQYYGREFTDNSLKLLRIKYDIKPQELEYIPREGAFIIVSNHPFGGVDGIILYNVISSMRPDLKMLSNFILSSIPNLKESFMAVNPFTDNKGLKNSFAGIRAAREHVANGGVLSIFPSGEVSTYYKNNRKYTCDKEWQPTMLKMIKSCEVPVLPIYFHGTNSKRFHNLGAIHPLLRTIRLPRELLNKEGQTISFRIGKPISVSEIAEFSDFRVMGKHLRNRTYALEANIPYRDIECSTQSCQKDMVPIDLPKSLKAMTSEIKVLEKKSKLFEVANFACYLADYDKIPTIIHQIGRKREESFRAVGEGTNTPLDLDKYDKYYKHLILWDTQRKNIVGAYRLGIGSEILKEYGINGFYTNELFNFSPKYATPFKNTIELGRSFVSIEYQKEALPLMLLIKGLLYSVMKYPDCKYLLGPASISSWYPKFYQSLMVYYLKEKHMCTDLPKIRARHPFTPNYHRVDPEYLLANKIDNVEKFDRFLLRLSDNEYRMPTLIKKYVKLNAKFLSFNVDKTFNDCLDGLIFFDLKHVPKDELLTLTKGSSEEELERILKRFGYGTGS